MGMVFAASASAQIDPSIAQQLLQSRGGITDTDQDTAPKATVQTYNPIPAPGKNLPQSNIEKLFKDRIGVELNQFGYDVLGVPTQVQIGQAGAAQDSFVLGQGDEVVLVLRGQENATYRYRVNRDGQIVFPKINPVLAAGRTFAEVRNAIETQVHQAFISTSAFVTLGEVRQVSVVVSGEVNSPGQRILSALGTPLDALLISGGISKTGSLRNVKIIRNGETRTIDFYNLLTTAGHLRLGNLQDGDRIFVPPIGRTVAVAGGVRRPGIYELSPGASGITAKALADLAGGISSAGAFRFMKVTINRDGTQVLENTSLGTTIRDGEVLGVFLQRGTLSGSVEFKGSLANPGMYPVAEYPTLSKVIHGQDDLAPEAYTAFAVVVRRDASTNARSIIPVSLEALFNGGPDLPLKSGDLVVVLSISQAASIAHAVLATANQAQTNASSAAIVDNSVAASPDSSKLASILADPDARNFEAKAAEVTSDRKAGTAPSAASVALTAAQREAVKEGLVSDDSSSKSSSDGAGDVQSLASTLNVSTDMLRNVVSDYVVWVLDEVGNPGPYLSAEGTSLRGIIHLAGGAMRQADLSWVEVTSTKVDGLAGTARTERVAYKGADADFAKALVHPLDVVRLRRVFSDAENGRVTLSGEFRYPGTFDIIRGERLSSIIERAGGITDQAYPYGAVFTRSAAATSEKDANERAARSLESALASLATQPVTGNEASTSATQRLTFLQSMAAQLRSQEVVGRISIMVDPAVLRAHPEMDTIVQPGDTLFIPKRPSTVNVSGEVLNPGSFQYRANYTVEDYVSLAGGEGQDSDDSRIFVVLPDGSAQPVNRSWLSFQDRAIPPGSTIVVPRDLRPFNFMQFAQSITQIASQLAIAAASLAVIGK